jgi:hypothetical protein
VQTIRERRHHHEPWAASHRAEPAEPQHHSAFELPDHPDARPEHQHGDTGDPDEYVHGGHGFLLLVQMGRQADPIA